MKPVGALPPLLAAPAAARQTALSPVDSVTLGSEPAPIRPRLPEPWEPLREAPLAPGVDRSSLLREVRNAVQDPGRHVHQGTHPHMCVPTTLEYRMAREEPARFVRLVAALFSPEGVAEAGLARPEGSLEDDGTGRSQLDRVVQGALYALAGAPAPDARYDSRTHAWIGGPEAQGLQPRQTRTLAEELTGDATMLNVPGSPGLVAHLGRQGSFLAALYTFGGGAHQVLVERVSDDRAVYRDPEGSRAKPFEGAVALDAERGVFALAVEDLEDQVAAVVAPARSLPAEVLPPEAWIL